MRNAAALIFFGSACVLASIGACKPVLPDPPKQCDVTGAGCLVDEICIDFKCVPRPKCSADSDCQSAAFQCVFPAQVCALREGFGQECQNPDAPCEPADFCALGQCLTRADARPCSRETDCTPGEKCDRRSPDFYCIPDCDCRLADQGFPECACDPEEQCDALSGHCTLACQNQCTTDADCQQNGSTNRCDGACRCVQCIADADCGAGLVCDERAGRCQSEDLCFSDADCSPPLVCDPTTALCQVAPPACEDDFDCAVGQKCDIASGRCIQPNGPCTRDRFEESDTPAAAQAITYDPANPLIDDLTLCPNDDDVFSIALHAGDLLELTIQRTDAAARATAWLLDSTGETSLRFTETPPRGSGKIVYTAQTDETVFLRLTALIDQTPYDVLVNISSGVPCSADAFEGATGNDDLITATDPSLFDTGIPLGATLCPGDRDLYRVNVAPGEAITATLNFDGSATDLDLALLDAQGTVLVQSAGTSAPERVHHRFIGADTVYLRVTGFGNNIGNYSLVVTHDPPFQCTADTAEPADNDIATAPVIALNQGLTPEPHTMCQADADLLVLPLEDFESVTVATTYDDSEVELTVEILDATATTVRATSPAGTGGAAVTYNAQGNETVVARVRGTGGAIGAYQLSVTKENQNTCAPDSAEPNNVVTARSALPAANTLLSICDNDQDYFAIDGIAGKKLVADATFRQADADIDLILLGLDGAQILATADGTSDNEHLEFILPLDGTYTLRVFSLTSGARAHYSLDVQQVSP